MYTSFFGFGEKPFNITPDPRFFYSNSVYNEVYANLLYAVKGRKGFAALTGEVGTGKTTLLRKLMDELATSARFVYFYNTNLTFEELLAFVCDELRLQINRRGGRLGKIQALNEFLLEQWRRGGTGVLLIDEAQNLGRDVLENLRLLSNMETRSEKLLQIILVGQPELRTKLDQPELRQLRQRISIYCRLDSLKEKEVGPFITYRLQAVGCKRSGLFTAEAIRKIAFYSAGIPRLVNVICDNALLISYGKLQAVVSAEIVDEVAHDLQSGEGRANDMRGPPVKTESEDSKRVGLYSQGHNGRDRDSIDVARNMSRPEKGEQDRPVARATEMLGEIAHDLQPEEGRADNRTEPAVKTETEDCQGDLYSKADNGRYKNFISLGQKESPNHDSLLDVQTRSAGGERIVDMIPTEKAISPIPKVIKNQETLINPSTVTAKILKWINVRPISNRLGVCYLSPAKALDRSEKAESIKSVSNNETSGIVPTQFLDLLSSALTDAMGPMAPVVVRDRLASLGHSSGSLPKGSLENLVESVSSEILDDVLKIAFKEKMSSVVRALNRDGHSVMEAT